MQATRLTNFTDPLGLIIGIIGDQKSANVALGYLRGDPKMNGLIDKLEKSPDVYTIITNTSLNGDYVDPTEDHVIHWNPNLGLQCERSRNGIEVGAMISPALSLGHEMVHTQYSNFWKLIDDDAYKDLQEKYVITEYENVAAQTLGEGVRLDHGGYPVWVPTPLTKPKCNCSGGLSPLRADPRHL